MRRKPAHRPPAIAPLVLQLRPAFGIRDRRGNIHAAEHGPIVVHHPMRNARRGGTVVQNRSAAFVLGRLDDEAGAERHSVGPPADRLDAIGRARPQAVQGHVVRLPGLHGELRDRRGRSIVVGGDAVGMPRVRRGIPSQRNRARPDFDDLSVRLREHRFISRRRRRGARGQEISRLVAALMRPRPVQVVFGIGKQIVPAHAARAS